MVNDLDSRDPVPRRLRVAMQLSAPPGPRAGGPGSCVQGMSDAMQRNPRLDVVVIAPSRARGEAGQRGSQLLLAFQQFQQLRRARPDVVHTHGHPGLLAAAVAYRALSRRSARVVFTSHIEPVKRGALWTRVVLGWLLSRCAAVTVFARSSIPTLGLLATPVPKPHVVHVVTGAATAHIRDKTDPEVVAFGASIRHHGGPFLLQVSNFVFPAKVAGSLRLLEALVTVRERFPSVHLLLLGTGPLVGSVREARERLGLTESVTIPGTFIDDLSLPVGLSDIHCHISLQDACPISILEAMHAGKPVVASRTGGIPETIAHGVNGLLVDDGPEEIARAIIDLLEHPGRALEMGARAQRDAQQRYTWARMAADFEAIYGLAPRRSADPKRLELATRVD